MSTCSPHYPRVPVIARFGKTGQFCVPWLFSGTMGRRTKRRGSFVQNGTYIYYGIMGWLLKRNTCELVDRFSYRIGNILVLNVRVCMKLFYGNLNNFSSDGILSVLFSRRPRKVLNAFIWANIIENHSI